MDYENSMTIGSGPYDNEEGEYIPTVEEVANDLTLTYNEINKDEGHIIAHIGDMALSFDFYRKPEEGYFIKGLTVKHDGDNMREKYRLKLAEELTAKMDEIYENNN